MKHKIRLFTLLFIILLLFNHAPVEAASKVRKVFIDWGYKLVASINDVFMDINTDCEDVSTSRFGKRFRLTTNLLWDLLTVGNVSFKFRAIDEGKWKKWVPSMYINTSYWNFLGSHIVNNVVDKVEVGAQGFSTALTFGKTFERTVQLFWGARYMFSYIKLRIGLGDVTIQGVKVPLGNIISQRSFIHTGSIYGGINYIRMKRGELVALVGYTLVYNKIYATIQYVMKSFTLGVGFYPETGYIIHPYFRIDINF